VWAVELLPWPLLLHGHEQRGGMVNTGAVSIKLQSTKLRLWSDADSFLTASVCMDGTRGHERE